MNDTIIQLIVGIVVLTVIVLIIAIGSPFLSSVHSETGTTASLPESMWAVVLIAVVIIGFVLKIVNRNEQASQYGG